LMLLFPLISLVWSLFKAFLYSDIKSIIACSTISQISYMFLALLLFPLCSIFHILIHALFKSLFFLISGSLIHVQSNFQSIYKMKLNNSMIKIIFIAVVIVLIFSCSKEGIIHYANSMYSSTFVYCISFLSGMLTTIYSLNIYIYCFYLSYYASLYSTFILSMLTITSILIDQCLDSALLEVNSFFFSLSFFALLLLNAFSDHFSLVFYFVIVLIFFIYFYFLLILLKHIHIFISYHYILFNYSSWLIIYLLIVFVYLEDFLYYSFDYRSSFFIIPFQYLFILFSTFFFKATIHSIEVVIGCSACYSVFHIHYFTAFQLILFFTLYSVLLFISVFKGYSLRVFHKG
jgi:NADH:ubiquinone oxidoreductase subunit 5 (subunit L)/multisubunit Na+/H+ antiporter MnhA subunit